MYYPPNQPPQYPPQPEQYQPSGWQQPSYPPGSEQYQRPPEWQSRQSYPYQQPQYTPPPLSQPPAPKKKSRKKLWLIVGIVLAILIIGSIAAGASGSGTSSSPNTTSQAAQPTATQLAQQATQASATLTAVPTQAPPTPTAVPKWTTTHSFSGNGIQKTAVFTVADDWKINWSCTPSSFYGGSYNVQVYVYGSDGSLVDVAINTICQAGNVGGSTEEHQGGQIYLDINSEGAWTVQVQELQ